MFYHRLHLSKTKLTQLEAIGIGKSVHIDQSTDWRSVRLMAFILFLLKMQFSVFFASIWPYMQEVINIVIEVHICKFLTEEILTKQQIIYLLI